MIQDFIERHPILTPVIFWGFLGLFAFGVIGWSDTDSDFNPLEYETEAGSGKMNCKNTEITLELVKDLGGDQFDEADKDLIKRMNDETPYCKELCLGELSNAIKYPDEWYTDKDVWAFCKSLNIELPQKY